jgi:hypothetical protein
MRLLMLLWLLLRGRARRFRLRRGFRFVPVLFLLIVLGAGHHGGSEEQT